MYEVTVAGDSPPADPEIYEVTVCHLTLILASVIAEMLVTDPTFVGTPLLPPTVWRSVCVMYKVIVEGAVCTGHVAFLPSMYEVTAGADVGAGQLAFPGRTALVEASSTLP